MRGITWSGIAVRYVIAFGLVCLTWNPSPYSYSRWALNNYQALAPYVMFTGLVLLVGWIVFVRATARSLGWFGILLALAVAGAILWMSIRVGLLDPTNHTALTWVLLALFAVVLTIGMSWSHLRRRWSGQVDIDDIDEPND